MTIIQIKIRDSEIKTYRKFHIPVLNIWIKYIIPTLSLWCVSRVKISFYTTNPCNYSHRLTYSQENLFFTSEKINIVTWTSIKNIGKQRCRLRLDGPFLFLLCIASILLSTPEPSTTNIDLRCLKGSWELCLDLSE